MLDCVFAGGFSCIVKPPSNHVYIKIYLGMSLCENHLVKVHRVAEGYSASIVSPMNTHVIFEDVVKIDINEHMAHEKSKVMPKPKAKANHLRSR